MNNDFVWKKHDDYDSSEEYKDEEIIEMSGYFHDKNCGSHFERGVRVHRPPFDSFFNYDSSFKTSAFFDPASGKITDVFYGNCTDFNEWFIGKIAKNERFYIVGYPEQDKPIQVHQVPGYVGDNRIKFRCNKLGQWRVA